MKSTTPRSERPIRRWISTVRPSGRPLVTSRCLRSPVEAGSIPYSDVSQPRPWPAIQRGTDSCTEAVQITRVSPQEISAEPVAVRTKPGSIVGRPQLVGRAAAAALGALTGGLRRGRAARGRLEAHGSTSPSGICRKRVPRARKPPRRPCTGTSSCPRPCCGEPRPRLPSTCSTWRASGAPERDDLHAAAEEALQHRPHERVVRAAEDHGVHAGLACSGAQYARTVSTTRWSNGKPPSMIAVRSGQAMLVTSTNGSAAAIAAA